MKRTLALFLLASVSLCAEPFQLPWKEVCHHTKDRELVITTETGETIDGYCVGIDVNEVSIETTGKPIKVAKAAVAKLRIIPRRYRVRALGTGMQNGLTWGVRALFSPAAVAGLVTIPATLAWGAVSLPFCVIGDLGAKVEPERDIRVK